MTAIRKTCGQCNKPQSVCMCSHFVRLHSSLRVLILQHPSESNKAYSTTFILPQCLPNVKIVVGELFSDSLLADLGFGGFEPLLLFPGDKAQSFGHLQGSLLKKPPVLVVIDGTWRKAKKILLSNSWLCELPRVSYMYNYKSCYPLRRSEKLGAEMLSTTEAVMHAAAEWEGGLTLPHGNYQLLQPLEALVEYEKRYMGLEKFNRYYNAK